MNIDIIWFSEAEAEIQALLTGMAEQYSIRNDKVEMGKGYVTEKLLSKYQYSPYFFL